MASKIDQVLMNRSNYAVWAPDMETPLKSKILCQYTKIVIPYSTDDQTKFSVDGKKDEVVGFITTYILWEIWFHLSGIDYPHQLWKNVKFLFNRVNESHVMQLEKDFISLYPHSFDIIEDYLVYVIEI
jgi:hypothetical protein